jgi:cell division protein FtsN
MPVTPVPQPPVTQAPAPQLSAGQPPVLQAPAPQPSVTQAPVSQAPVSHTSVLQTGLFSRPENAQAQAETLKKAGFTSEIFSRQVNGASYWAVGVPYGSDMSSMIKNLKDAGFESFPINR